MTTFSFLYVLIVSSPCTVLAVCEYKGPQASIMKMFEKNRHNVECVAHHSLCITNHKPQDSSTVLTFGGSTTVDTVL